MKYSIEEHTHRFAAWAASRAASVISCRFPVEKGRALLEGARLGPRLSTPDNLPIPECFDAKHREWRERIIADAKMHELPDFTHGVAAKLINVYLKCRFVCGGHHDHSHVKAIHPPIDSVLLDELNASDFGGLRQAWREARRIRWSKFNSQQYEDVIQNIRVAMKGSALWEVEQHWQGYTKGRESS